MDEIKQWPPPLAIRALTGKKLTVSLTATGATITDPVVVVYDASGALVTGAGPTVSVASGVVTIAWSAAQTALMNTSGAAAAYSYELSGLVDGDGPFALSAGPFTLHPPGTAGISTSVAAALTVTVGSTAVTLTVSTGAGAAGQRDSFAGKSGVPAVADLGGGYIMWGGSIGIAAYPTVSGGKLTSTMAGAGASYAQLPASGMTRVGGRFTFSTYSTTAGAAVLIGWASSIAATWPTIPDSPCHLAISPTNAIYGVWQGNVFTQVASWTFTSPLTADGVAVHSAQVIIDAERSTAYCTLPDGSVRTVTHAAIGSVSTQYACWEIYRQATTDSLAGFSSLYADADLIFVAPAKASAVAYDANVTAATLRPVATVYAPGSNVSVSVPGAEADAHASLTVDVIAPPSGKVLITLTGILAMSGSDRVFWSVRSGSTTYGTVNVVSQQFSGQVIYSTVVTGLTASSGYTFRWRHWELVAGTAVLKLDSPNGFQASMIATPLFS